MPKLKGILEVFNLWLVTFNNGEENYFVLPSVCTFQDLAAAVSTRGKFPENVLYIKLVSLACHVFEETKMRTKK